MDANPVNIYEYEEIAKGKMGQGEYDFIAGAATDEITLRRTRAVFDSIMLRPRMMVDISQRDLHTTVLGQAIRFPIMMDPAGNHAAAHPEGELASARAAGAAGTIMVLSAQSSQTSP
jgi:4-hydroxymandelate oxidase